MSLSLLLVILIGAQKKKERQLFDFESKGMLMHEKERCFC